jgi:protein TonB
MPHGLCDHRHCPPGKGGRKSQVKVGVSGGIAAGIRGAGLTFASRFVRETMSSPLVVIEKDAAAKSKATLQEVGRTAGPVAVRAAVPQRPLFSQSFVEMSGADAKRRRWSTGTTFLIQAIILAIAVLVPFMMTDVLPAAQLANFLVAPPPPPPPPPPATKVARVVTEVVNGQLLTPSRIPQTVKMIKEEEAPVQTSGIPGGVEGGVPGGQSNGVLASLLPVANKSTAPVVAVPKRLRVSTGISTGLLVQRVEPVYPGVALRAHIQGTVTLAAIISREGNIENLKLISGHPLLVPAAIDAVKQWRYKPYMLSGEPLEVETTIIVNFHLDR